MGRATAPPDESPPPTEAACRSARRLDRSRIEADGWIEDYLAAVLDGANAAGTLAGFPAAGRRVALGLQNRAEELGRPEIYGGFLRLIGAEDVSREEVAGGISSLARVYDGVSTTPSEPLLAGGGRARS